MQVEETNETVLQKADKLIENEEFQIRNVDKNMIKNEKMIHIKNKSKIHIKNEKIIHIKNKNVFQIRNKNECKDNQEIIIKHGASNQMEFERNQFNGNNVKCVQQQNVEKRSKDASFQDSKSDNIQQNSKSQDASGTDNDSYSTFNASNINVNKINTTTSKEYYNVFQRLIECDGRKSTMKEVKCSK